MTNVRIKSQNRSCVVGRKRYEYFDVIADTERFGKNGIMFQGTFKECLGYLRRNGIDYLTECVNRNGKRDVQVSFRMYRVVEKTEDGMVLLSRDGFERNLFFKDMTPVAPNTFKIPKDLFGDGTATVKLMDARAW